MAWWAGQPKAWNLARERVRDPKMVMEEFHVFALDEGRHTGRPVMVAYPAAFDAMWITWYLLRFTSGDPFRRRCVDLKTLAMQLLGGGYAAAGKQNTPPIWLPGKCHSHVAVEDAIKQGEIFVNVVGALREERRSRAETRPGNRG